jgi:mRNA-degrading endonuclease RelE of RelBE toxin-antitoxin system
LGFKVFLHPNAAKALRKLDKENKVAIKKMLGKLTADPWKAGKLLCPSDFWGASCGKCRVIYEIDDKKRVTVLFVGDRKKVHDDFSKIL